MQKITFTRTGEKPASKNYFLLVVSLFLFSANTMAQGDLLIFPKRLVFDASVKSQSLNLSNTGADTARYIISVVQIRMKEDGSFETITEPDPGQNFADKNIRFFPRSVVLGPNEAQTVKVQIVRAGELTDGEYRSHIYFRSEPEKQPLGEDAKKDTSSISIKLTPVFGISVPVIVRIGESTMDIHLSKVAFQMENDTIPTLKLTVNRTGNMSVYGDLSVDHIAPQGKVTRVTSIKGLAVYTPNAKRNFRLMLEKADGVDYKQGSLHIVFTDQSGKKQKVAQEQIFLR